MVFVQLTADGGDMTLVRRTACYAYGERKVTLPEGFEEIDQEEETNHGYVYRPSHAPQGKFDFAFVKADIQVQAHTQNGEGVSNAEQVLDAALTRSQGDVFFERDISGVGLGRFIPGVHFDTGDIVGVRIWGKVLDLPVTARDMMIEDGQLVERVHVGGQIISDAKALAVHNEKIQQQIEADKRKFQRSLTQVRSVATRASNTVNTVVEILRGTPPPNISGLDEKTRAAAQQVQAVTRAANIARNWTIENQQSFNQAVSLAQSAQAEVNDFNRIAWLEQSEWNREKDRIDAQQNRQLQQAREFQTQQQQINAINQDFRTQQTRWNSVQDQVTGFLSRSAVQMAVMGSWSNNTGVSLTASGANWQLVNRTGQQIDYLVILMAHERGVITNEARPTMESGTLASGASTQQTVRSNANNWRIQNAVCLFTTPNSR